MIETFLTYLEILRMEEEELEVEKLESWDSTNKNLNLGDFKTFAEYLRMNFGIIAQLQNLKVEGNKDEDK